MKTSPHIDRPARRRWLALCLSGGIGLGGLGGVIGQDTPPPAETDKSGAATEAEEAEEAEELTEWRGGNTEFTGWVNLTLGEAFLDLNKPEFRRRFGANSGGFGGVSDLYYENFVGDNGMIRFGGRGLGGRDTYGFNLDYIDDTIGYLKFGFDRKRSWSTGNGGFFTPLSTWQPLDADNLHLDREKFWVKAGLTLEDRPTFRLGYSHETRNGAVDSTVWGSPSAFTGRGVAATFRGIDETRDTVTVDVEHTVGATDGGLGFRFESSRIDNTLNIRNDVGLGAEDRTTQRDGIHSDMFNVHAFTDTTLKTNLTFSTGYSFTQLDTDLAGSRIVGATFDPVFDPALARFPGYLDLAGGTVLNQHVVSLNLLYQPAKAWTVVPSIRFESSSLDGNSFYTATPGAGLFRQVGSEEDFLDFSERLEIRYTGLPNWVFYSRNDWEQNDGDMSERQLALDTGTQLLGRDTEYKRFAQKYTVGANWYPRPKLNLAAEYYFKRRDNDYDHLLDTTGNTTGNRYPAYLTSQNFDTHDINLRLTARPAGGVVTVTRYDHQVSRVDTAGNNLGDIRSADIDSHIISQSLTWSPLARLYLQGTGSYVIDTTDTPTVLSGTTAVVTQSENSYWTAGLAAGYALDLKTDLDVDYVYTRADNYFDNSAGSQPYGAGFEEHRVLTTLTRRVSENLRLLFRYGWFQNRDETFGSNLNYTAHLVSTSLQYRF